MPKTKQCTKCKKRRILKQFKTTGARVCTPCQKSRAAGYSREVHLRETYDISLAEYDAILLSQNGACFICNGKRNYNLHVDHCHKTGIVRGLLCKMCNKRLLPAARDNIDRLQRAIVYLTDPPATQVIGERITPDMR